MLRLFLLGFLLSSIAFATARSEAEITAEQRARIQYKAELGEQVLEEVDKLGLVDLRKYTNVKFKDFSFAHPAFIYMLAKVEKDVWRVTEAYPITVRHISKCHFNGRCIDLTVKNGKKAAEVCKKIDELKDFRCVNEYQKKYSTTTGKHLHIEYTGI